MPNIKLTHVWLCETRETAWHEKKAQLFELELGLNLVNLARERIVGRVLSELALNQIFYWGSFITLRSWRSDPLGEVGLPRESFYWRATDIARQSRDFSQALSELALGRFNLIILSRDYLQLVLDQGAIFETFTFVRHHFSLIFRSDETLPFWVATEDEALIILWITRSIATSRSCRMTTASLHVMDLSWMN